VVVVAPEVVVVVAPAVVVVVAPAVVVVVAPSVVVVVTPSVVVVVGPEVLVVVTPISSTQPTFKVSLLFFEYAFPRSVPITEPFIPNTLDSGFP
jgi:hypothetical protein